MKIAGLNKCSLIDYPGVVSAVIFTRGCNLRCQYCHNPQLVYPDMFGGLFDNNVVLDFLRERAGKLDGVVITGGEPTLQYGLESFLVHIKRLGYKVKLDTNGTHPQLLKRLISAALCDYVAMDIKAPFEKYEQLTGVLCDTSVIKESIRLIENSGIEYQFRTTFDKSFLDISDLEAIRNFLSDHFHYLIQECLPVPVSI